MLYRLQFKNHPKHIGLAFSSKTYPHLSWQDPLHEANRAQLALDLKLKNLVFLQQEHAAKIIDLSLNHSSGQAADASFLQQGLLNQIGAAILSADCLPILLTNKTGDFIAAIHAGWRSLLAGIIENTLLALKEPKELLVCFGPSISQAFYEVDAKLYQAFTAVYGNLVGKSFQAQGGDKYLFDLKALARNILAKFSILEILDPKFCSVANNADFYSHRKFQTGRNASIIYFCE